MGLRASNKLLAGKHIPDQPPRGSLERELAAVRARMASGREPAAEMRSLRRREIELKVSAGVK